MSALMDSALPNAVQERLKKHATKLSDEFVENVDFWIKESLASWLAGYVEDMADRAIESMLQGNEQMFRRYLKCEQGGWTGRDREHPVIHGRLFEADSIETRRKLCEAFPDLLKNERILDLEDQVKSLVDQVRKLEAEYESLFERMRAYA